MFNRGLLSFNSVAYWAWRDPLVELLEKGPKKLTLARLIDVDEEGSETGVVRNTLFP